MTTIWDSLQDGSRWALATVVRQLRSAPRDAGTMMAVSSDGRVVGNVSAGCVDAEVCATAEIVLSSAEPQLSQFGVSDEKALSAGLSCGGAIEVLVTPAPASALVSRLTSSAHGGESTALVTILEPERLRGSHLVVAAGVAEGSTGDLAVDRMAVEAARERADVGGVDVVERDGARCLVQWFQLRPRLLVFGAMAYAESIAALGRLLGYHVVVCDARSLFATKERVPSADEVVVDWPHRYLRNATIDRRTVILSLVHDDKFEIPLLTAALRSPAGYVGALGSRRTSQRRLEALRDAGLSQEELGRLRAPIGLDLGAHSTVETAISVFGEVIAVARGASGRPLSILTGPIHHQQAS